MYVRDIVRVWYEFKILGVYGCVGPHLIDSCGFFIPVQIFIWILLLLVVCILCVEVNEGVGEMWDVEPKLSHTRYPRWTGLTLSQWAHWKSSFGS